MLNNEKNKNCIRTFSGKYLDVFNPDPEQICIEDIAHALSHQCRFAGHMHDLYSVAQHSIMCSQNTPEKYRLEALLHDASEAYLLDIPTPIKQQMPEYIKAEDQLMKAIAEKFGFTYPLPEPVKKADKEMLEYEYTYHVKVSHACSIMSARKAKRIFLAEYERLKRV